jgi:DNA-binding CsgD family transcriptional regulator
VTTHSQRAGTLARLTPQELQVALRVAAGASNQEAATELFVSPKTIEFHLANVYRKLQLRSRSELARAIAAQQAEATAEAVSV